MKNAKFPAANHIKFTINLSGPVLFSREFRG
jgi:hypothetical protein